MLFNLYLNRETNELSEILSHDGEIFIRGEDYQASRLTSEEFRKYAFVGKIYESFKVPDEKGVLLKVHIIDGKEKLQVIERGMVQNDALIEGLAVAVSNRTTWFRTSLTKSIVKSDGGKTYDIYTLNSHYRMVFP